MTHLNPYLIFEDQCEEAFKFYESVFDSKIAFIQKFKDTPEGVPKPEGEEEKIMHVSLPIGKNTILMGSDSPSSQGPVIKGNNVQISVHPESEDEAHKIFDGLSAGGEIFMKMEKTFWGALFGMCKDKFGVQWMVNYELPKS